ncbi:hypothetical protein CDL12_21455 [Handroanthus impetiginosus]|uniref:Uncharacterized protein n=1 Tax=Handroanthus impetiginosus TaxID=429701 RepID=A0A2G9GLA8_9LAMI|nr:hypothetical protein CDL12_21455 [Handroanthus impetiginosus]
MDTLSSSVSTFKLPSLYPKSPELHNLKNHLPRQSYLINSSTTGPSTSKVSNKATSNFTTTQYKNLTLPCVNSSQAILPPLKQSSKREFNHKASSGYAVALLDVARSKNLLEEVEKDVKRLSKWLRNEQLQGIITNPFVDTKEKGEIVKEMVKKGKFNKHLVKLVNLLAEKTKVEILSEVLMEFGRIYDELIGSTTQVVLVPCGVKMEENQVFKIAKRVQKISGAVKVKVRQLVDGRLPSFAV